MKKVLLGTSALIAAGFIAAPAMAQEKIQLGIGGKMEQYFGVVSMDEAVGEERSTTGIDTDTEVYFTGATTLDNGLTVGAVIQLEAEVNDGATDTDEQYAYIEGSFGRIMAGEKEGVNAQFAHTAPSVGLGNGDIDDWTRDFSQFQGTNAVDTTSSADIPSVTYITPNLAGFSLGATFQPGFGARTINENTTVHNRWQVSAAYNGEFSGVGIGADIAYLTEDNANTAGVTDDDMDMVRGGLVLSYAGFTVGGSVMNIDGNTANDREELVWDLGVAYETGPFGVSLAYSRAERDTPVTGAQDTEVEYQQVHLGTAYKMGPGIKLAGSLFWANNEVDAAGTAADTDADGFGGVVGLQLSF